MTPHHEEYPIDYEIREDDRVLNVMQVVLLAVFLIAVCCFAARSVGLGWGTTLALSWGCGIFGTLLITVAMFAIQEAVDRFQNNPAHAEGVEDLDALIGLWDDDLASDAMSNGSQVWHGSSSDTGAYLDNTPIFGPIKRAAAS